MDSEKNELGSCWDYLHKIKQLNEQFDKAKSRTNFSYENMGMIDEVAEKQVQKLAQEITNLSDKAEAWASAHPDWFSPCQKARQSKSRSKKYN